jgi:hypothetical protein
MQSISYLENTQVLQAVEAGLVYQKTALTGLRLPAPQEIGTTLITYVSQDGQLRKESESVISNDVVIARNNQVIGQNEQGQDVYNEWPIPKVTAVKNYGEQVVSQLGSDFTYHRKQATVRAIQLTGEVLSWMGVQGDKLAIKVSWSTEPMIAHIGDYLTSGGYSISAHDMKDYTVV